MTEKQTTWRIDFARQIAQTYIANPKVKVVVISGSVSRGQADAYSDIELDVFWQEAPTEAERIQAIEQVNGRIILLEPFADDEWSEDYLVGDVQMDLSSFLIKTMDHYIADVLAGDTAVLKHLRMAAMQQAIPLYGHEQVQQWQSQINYPEKLAHNVIAQNLRFEALGIWYLRDTLLARGDLLMLHDVFCKIQQRILGTLCGLNRIFIHHPGYKWQDDLASQMTIKPPNLSERLQQVFLTPPAEGVLIQHTLLVETIALVANHMPEIDLAPAYRALHFQRKTLYASPTSSTKP